MIVLSSWTLDFLYIVIEVHFFFKNILLCSLIGNHQYEEQDVEKIADHP
jgi:hypothetical protein